MGTRHLVPITFAGMALALAASAAVQPTPATTSHATFAGGCFWSMVLPFEKLPGVVSVTSGYTGGRTPNPTYELVSSGTTGYAESVDVVYDSSRIAYERLLDAYLHNTDPLTAYGQFCDEGRQYRPAIFFHDETQRRLAEDSKERVAAQLHEKVMTEITAATPFHPAEDYHQGYARKNPERYGRYREACGRDQRLEEIWGTAAGH